MSVLFSEKLIERLSRASFVVAFTGAGVSAESGVPTFRGENGLWKNFRVEELANFDAFMRNPDLVWEWYAHRKEIMSTIEPNPGHHALVKMEEMFSEFAVITQNIDNLHRRAGSKRVYELHGNIERNYCVCCGATYGNKELLLKTNAPRCTRFLKKVTGEKICGGLVRPDVVWFGEMLPEDEWNGSESAAQRTDVFLSIGTSSVVYPAASLPILAKRSGAYLIEINPEPTPLTDSADEFLKGSSGAILPSLVARIREARRSLSSP